MAADGLWRAPDGPRAASNGFGRQLVGPIFTGVMCSFRTSIHFLRVSNRGVCGPVLSRRTADREIRVRTLVKNRTGEVLGNVLFS